MLEMENRANIYRMDMVASMETVKNKLEENVESIPKDKNSKIWRLLIFVKSKQ